MLTPQEISNREFTKAVFGGYDMSSVDEFIEAVAADFSALYKENAILKSKLKVLVDKVEEYRSTEDAMRMALLTAQTMGDEIIAEANTKRDEILAQAEDVANNKVSSVREELSQEQERLRLAKEETAKYVGSIRQIIKQQEQFLGSLSKLSGNADDGCAKEASAQPESQPEQPVESAQSQRADDKEDAIMGAAIEIDSAVSKLIENTPDYHTDSDDTQDQTKVFKKRPHYDDEDEPTSPRPKFNFDDLQFGSNYDTGRIQ
jgi:cell division initiation protein